MPMPPRLLAALTLAVTLLAGALPIPAAAPPPAVASIVTPYVPAASEAIAPGATHEWGTMSTSTGLQKVNAVVVQPGSGIVRFEAALSNDRVGGLERTSALAVRRSHEGHRVVAAINGDVWSGYASDMEHAPNGLHIQDGELMVAGPSSRATFGVDASGRPMIGNAGVAVGIMALSGTSVVIDRVNQERRAGEVVLYTSRFGSRTSTAASGTDVVITGMAMPLRASGSWTGVVAALRPADGGGPIPPDGIVLTMPATSFLLTSFVPGDPVTLTTTITSGWEGVTHAVGGREWVVRDGAQYIYPRPSSADVTHPRSAIGLTADGRVIMMTVDGRQPDESLGVRLPELAELLVARGVVAAINLDGGGSTTLAVRRAGEVDPTVVNSPSGGSERAVTNGIQLVSTAPTGPLAQLAVLPGTETVYERQSVTYRVVGTDAAYNPVALPGGSVSWAVTAPVGTVDPAGRFVAGAPGSAQIVATANGVTGTASVTVLPDTTPPTVSAPVERLPAGRSISATGGVPVTVSWNAATDVGSGVAGYRLQQSVDGAQWTEVALSPGVRSATLTLPRAHVYRFQVRAIDRAGNASPWRMASAFALAVAPETTRALTFVTGTWSRITSVSYDRLYARSTRTPNGTARFTFTGDAFAWVAAKSPVRGVARVYVDGLYVGAVNTYRSTPLARVMVASRAWSGSGRHTVEIRAVGTVGHPRVDIDAFVVLTPQAGYPVPPPAPEPAP